MDALAMRKKILQEINRIMVEVMGDESPEAEAAPANPPVEGEADPTEGENPLDKLKEQI